MGFFHQEDLELARELVRMFKLGPHSERPSEDDLRDMFNRMGFTVTKENEMEIMMAFSLGALANEPEDSEWVKGIGLKG